MEKQIKYCVTADIDWANEKEIKYMLDWFKKNKIPITVFATHDSQIIKKSFKPKDIGLHFNFMNGDMLKVIRKLRKIYPDSYFFRNHCFFNNTPMLIELHKQGFVFDSNICTYMADGLKPILNCAGGQSYPVFLEDDVLLLHKNMDKEAILNKMSSEGLKIINIHPIHFYLNTPDMEYYTLNKINKIPYEGYGIRTLFIELLLTLKYKGHKFVTFQELIR